MKNKKSEISPLSLSVTEFNIVRDILQAFVPNYSVWAFGSRANGTPKAYSDLDLAIITTEPLPLSVRADLTEAFSESNLPFKVDIVDWAITSESFQRLIKENKIVIQ